LAVGLVGFAIEGFILTALVQYGEWSPYSGRLVSFTTASFATWVLNRRFTFSAASASSLRSRASEYSRYIVVQVGGAASNLAVFVAVVWVRPELAAVPVVPLAIGAAAGLVVNFSGSKLWVFRRN